METIYIISEQSLKINAVGKWVLRPLVIVMVLVNEKRAVDTDVCQ